MCFEGVSSFEGVYWIGITDGSCVDYPLSATKPGPYPVSGILVTDTIPKKCPFVCHTAIEGGRGVSYPLFY